MNNEHFKKHLFCGKDVGTGGTARRFLILLGDDFHILEGSSVITHPTDRGAPPGSASQQLGEAVLSRFFSWRQTAVRQMEIITRHAQNSAKQLGGNWEVGFHYPTISKQSFKFPSRCVMLCVSVRVQSEERTYAVI